LGIVPAQTSPPGQYALTPLAPLGGSQSAASDISEFGNFIVGRVQTTANSASAASTTVR
jgi:uncharacterized membrane protein